MDSQWIIEFLESDYKGQNSLDWGIPYIKLRRVKNQIDNSTRDH